MKRMLLTAAAFLAGSAMVASALESPTRLNDGDEPINVDVGHAAPYYADMDGDGVRDLLVGQFGQGKLRIYKNIGTDAEPAFDGFEWFEADGTVVSVPTG